MIILLVFYNQCAIASKILTNTKKTAQATTKKKRENMRTTQPELDVNTWDKTHDTNALSALVEIARERERATKRNEGEKTPAEL